MNDIGFPKNLPEEFKADFVAAFNEINRLKEENNSLKMNCIFSEIRTLFNSRLYFTYEFFV